MNNQIRYFRVKYGYNVSDQVSIPESELEKAIYAQIKGVPINLGNSYINGRNIIAISPHWHKHTGWHDWYEPKDGEDWKQIKRDCPDYDGVIETSKERVRYLMENNKENLIGKGVEIKQLQPKVEGSSFSKELTDKFSINGKSNRK